uniref:Replicative DNA helicase n=1 Tax=uncultured Nocardioidaceae bacterium TaxID=253824 RepID=A0A6J4L9A2_9ACTN|nr:MAG: Replicative DNA helicase (DnaB) [uncultured Nocardioidaceae bacterium]
MSVSEMPAATEPPDDFNEIFGGPPGTRSDFDKPAPVGRTPPQDNDAEQSVLGAMLLSKDAIADVVEAIRAVDFYRPAHELIFDAIVDLYGRGEPADAVTIAAHLTRRGELTKVGGAPYLHELVAGVPIAANAGYYAEIVREKAILRRLVDAGTKIAQLGYAGEGQVDDTVDRAQAEIFSVTDRRTTEDYLPLSEIMAGTLDEIEAISSHEGGLSGVPTGFADLDELTNGLQGGQMIIVAARPAIGKSTIGLDFCRSASIKHGMTSAIFSLEMSRNEITMRLLSAEARIALNHMRNGHMTDDDWSRLARKMGEVSSAPLFIDDSANLTMMEIRAKARRLKQRHDLKLVVVDYLQLLSSGKKVESRQLEVSEFSRQIKLLAKELDVPIVAISQLNRGAEQRTDKRPLLSDLRESGCLTADTRLTRADTGVGISLGELLANDVRAIPVWALDDRLKLVPRTLTHAFASGVKETFRVRLASGRTVDATASHPFLTYDGWRPLRELEAGSRVGSLRHVPPPLQVVHRADDEIVLLADSLADSLADGSGADCPVPPWVFALPKHQVGLFLGRLWTRRGAMSWDSALGQAAVSCTTPSRRMADDLAALLLRFNVFAHVIAAGAGWVIEVRGADDQQRFCSEIGLHGASGVVAAEILARMELARISAGPAPVPAQVWDRLRTTMAPDRRCIVAQPPGSTMYAGSPTPSRLGQVATILDEADLEMLATNDVVWDEVVDIEPIGQRDVYDATVLGNHNFVANGVALHNSLEQDADMVILLHREDAYEKESTRPGEGDLIVAKHRAGPTDTIVVAFQGHYSRFVDMQQT